MAIAQEQAAAIAQVYAAAAQSLNSLTELYSATEQVAWVIKLPEARAIVANRGHQGELLREARATLQFLGIAAPTDEQVQSQLLLMATAIVEQADQLLAAEATIIGWRSARLMQIAQAQTSEALAGLDLTPPL